MGSKMLLLIALYYLCEAFTAWRGQQQEPKNEQGKYVQDPFCKGKPAYLNVYLNS